MLTMVGAKSPSLRNCKRDCNMVTNRVVCHFLGHEINKSWYGVIDRSYSLTACGDSYKCDNNTSLQLVTPTALVVYTTILVIF